MVLQQILCIFAGHKNLGFSHSHSIKLCYFLTVFNILFVVGTTALITPVAFKMGFLIDSAVALTAGLILWFGVMKDQKLKRPVGILMLAVYAVYFVYLLMG